MKFRVILIIMAVLTAIIPLCSCKNDKLPIVVDVTPAETAPESPSDATPGSHEVLTETEVPINPESPVSFVDPYFEAAVREIIEKPIGNIYASELSEIKELSLRVRGIRYLDDVIYFTSLEELDIYGNKVCDISPLASIQTLKKLTVRGNYSSVLDKSGQTGLSLRPLANLVKLEFLDVSSNSINDVSPLIYLTNLKYLDISGNKISSITALENLVNIIYLDASNNRLSDCSALRHMTKLQNLILTNNHYVELSNNVPVIETGIQDLSFLSVGFDNLSKLYCGNNLISDFGFLDSLPKLSEFEYAGNPVADITPIKRFIALHNFGG